MMANDPNSLLELIRKHYNRDELQTLCLTLGIDYEDLPVGLSKTGEVRELILLFSRQDRLADLVEYCQQTRPKAPWPNPYLVGLNQLLGAPVKPPQPYEPETVSIPAGDFLMGSLAADSMPVSEQPQHQLMLPDYGIGRYPVTNGQYSEFLDHANYPIPRSWLGTSPPRGKEYHPIVNVSWHDALAYCQWLTKQTGRPYRLPTEAEWEKAARGLDGRRYPWGNDWKDHFCNHNGHSTTAVDAFPQGESPFGCQDMIGNVREWTSTIWGHSFEEPKYPYPYCVDDGREDGGQDSNVYRVVRSSSYKDRQNRHRCSARTWYAPDNRNKRRGFRIVIAL